MNFESWVNFDSVVRLMSYGNIVVVSLISHLFRIFVFTFVMMHFKKFSTTCHTLNKVCFWNIYRNGHISNPCGCEKVQSQFSRSLSLSLTHSERSPLPFISIISSALYFIFYGLSHNRYLTKECVRFSIH